MAGVGALDFFSAALLKTLLLSIWGYLKDLSRAVFHVDPESRIHLGLLAVAFAVESPEVEPSIFHRLLRWEFFWLNQRALGLLGNCRVLRNASPLPLSSGFFERRAVQTGS